MSKPILIPLGLRRFLHPHVHMLLYEGKPPGNAAPELYCESIRPILDPMIEPMFVKQGYVRDFTPCGQIIHWRLK